MPPTITKWVVQFAITHQGNRKEWITLNDGEDGGDIHFPTPEWAQKAFDDVKKRQPEMELRVATVQVPA